MAKIEKQPAGAFCWIELHTTDQDAAKQFYAGIFGWSSVDIPMGPDGVYTMFKLAEGDVGAACTLRPDQQSAGVPPHWLLYVAVKSADQAAALVKKLGGKILAGPFDVMESGRMAVAQDPTGAIFSIWQANQHEGITVTGEDGTLCWADLNTPQPDVAAKFYSALFGWDLMKGEEGYLHIKNAEEFIGGIPPVREQAQAPPHWLPYFLTSSADETSMNADARGGKLFMPPMTMDKVGRIAVIADPQGAVFALYEAARQAA
jgi:predicted enzyme related to lactoylglutathione lyase